MFVVGDAVCGTDALCHVALAFIALLLVALTRQAQAALLYIVASHQYVVYY